MKLIIGICCGDLLRQQQEKLNNSTGSRKLQCEKLLEKFSNSRLLEAKSQKDLLPSRNSDFNSFNNTIIAVVHFL